MRRNTPLGAIVVGAGLMAPWHASAVVRCGGRVEAVIDSDLSRARLLAARYPAAAAARTLGAVLVPGRVCIVHVCTPTYTHEAVVAEAILAGCHVLVEKPVGRTLAATRRLADLAAARGVLLCPVHQFVFQRGLLGVIRAMNRIGNIRHLDIVVCSSGADGRDPAGRDEIAFDILPHPFSLLCRLLGARFGEMRWHTAHAGPGELRLSAVAEGLTAGVVISMSGRPTLNVLRIAGDRGSAVCDLFHGFAIFEDGTVSRRRKVLRPFSTAADSLVGAAANLGRRVLAREYAYPGLRELVRRFRLAAAIGGESPITPDEMLAVAAARDDVIAACAVGGASAIVR